MVAGKSEIHRTSWRLRSELMLQAGVRIPKGNRLTTPAGFLICGLENVFNIEKPVFVLKAFK